MEKQKKPELTNEKRAVRILRTTLVGNILLTAFKLLAGLLAGSAAMVSDAVHSLSDAMGEIIVIIGMKLSHREADKEHPYGHERLECVAGILLSFILLVVGTIIGWGGMQRIIGGNYGDLAVPGVLALIAAVVSIVLKEAMYWFTIRTAKKIDSVALKAAAWHHRSDAMSSVGSFAGILGARLGLPVLDSVACVIICTLILKVAFDIFVEAVAKLTDTACDDAFVEEIRAVILSQEHVLGIDLLKTRLFGNRIYVDVEVSMDAASTLHETHNAAQRIHDAIEAKFHSVKHCVVHVNPALLPVNGMRPEQSA